MATPPPRWPSGGLATLLMLLLVAVVAALLVWAFCRTNPSRPVPAGTANPKVLPPTRSGGAAPLH